MKSIPQKILLSCISLSTLLLSSCGFWKKDLPTPPTQPQITPTVSSPSPSAPPLLPTSRTLVFSVDSQLTTGTIDLAMNPKGAMLGTRQTSGTAPLSGKVVVKITEDPSTGKKEMSIQDIRLTNTKAYNMNFSWGALVGSMSVNIAKGVLRILPNEMNRTSILEPNQPFTLPQSYFTVLGHSQVRGKGLVLAKAVGNKKVNLTMKKTEPVTLRGTITTKAGVTTLRIPQAVLRDHFDLDGTQLGLVFTADITATAQNL